MRIFPKFRNIITTAFPPFVLLVLFVFGVASSQAAEKSNTPRATTILGSTRVGGQEVIVEIVVAVQPGENAHAAAQAVLRRAYPDAREINSSEFNTNGLVWDVFSDQDPGNNQVEVRYNPKDVPANLVNHRDFWLASHAVWTNVTSSKFVFSDGGDTGKCPSLVRECKGRQTFDGNNDVGWLDIADPSVLGVTWYGTVTDEFDMALDNKNFSWYTGEPAQIPANYFDAQTVWGHEFGHGLGLGHSEVNSSVMEPFYEGVRRALHQDDIDGITFLYPGGAVTPTPTPTPMPTTTPTTTPTPQPGNTVSVSSIDYDTEGGRNKDRHLLITISVVSNLGNPVSGASVSIDLGRDGLFVASGTGTTGATGIVTFSLKNAASGCYTTTVIDVAATGFNWNGSTPANVFCK